MKIEEALKLIISTDGSQVILDPKIVNVLSDFQAYNEVPAAKYVLRAIITDGYARQLLAIGKWNNDCQRLIDKYVTVTGFQYNIVNYLFQSLEYGLGWINSIENPKNNNNDIIIKREKQSISNFNINVEDMTEEQFEAYMWSKIVWDHEAEKQVGLTFSNYHILIDSNESAKLIFEIKGQLKVNFFSLHYVTYDEKKRPQNNAVFACWGNYEKIPDVYSSYIHHNKSLNLLSKIVFSVDFH